VSTTTSRKPRKLARNKAILPHQNRKIPHTTICAKGYTDSLWDKRGVILEHYMPKGNTVTSATCADLLKNHLLPATKPKRRRRLSTGDLLQHDSALLHTASSNVTKIQDLSFECLPRPPYSPDYLPVTLKSLDLSKWRWEASLSGPTKRCNRRCTSGGALGQKIFFRGIHALPKR
jgi:transposase